MAKRRKLVTMLLTVSAPAGMPAAAVRTEVRSLITDQCNYFADPGDIKVRRLRGKVAT